MLQSVFTPVRAPTTFEETVERLGTAIRTGILPAGSQLPAERVLADELGMRPLQAHCHLGLGTLYSQMGRREEARAALSTAIAMYRAMAMTFWLPQTEATLAQVDTEDHRHP